MPWEIEIDREAWTLVARIRGGVDGPDVLKLSNDVRSHPDNQPGLRHLYDFSEADVSQVFTPDLRPVAGREPLHEVVCYAIVAPSDVAFGLSRIFEAIARGREGIVAVFRTQAEARRWMADPRPLGEVDEVDEG